MLFCVVLCQRIVPCFASQTTQPNKQKNPPLVNTCSRNAQRSEIAPLSHTGCFFIPSKIPQIVDRFFPSFLGGFPLQPSFHTGSVNQRTARLGEGPCALLTPISCRLFYFYDFSFDFEYVCVCGCVFFYIVLLHALGFFLILRTRSAEKPLNQSSEYLSQARCINNCPSERRCTADTTQSKPYTRRRERQGKNKETIPTVPDAD